MSQGFRQVAFERGGSRRLGWVSADTPLRVGKLVRFVGEPGTLQEPRPWWTVATIYPTQVARDNTQRVYELKGYWVS